MEAVEAEAWAMNGEHNLRRFPFGINPLAGVTY